MHKCCTTTRDRFGGVLVLNYFPHMHGHQNHGADVVGTGTGEWSFVTENGVRVEIGRRTHRPGYGISYSATYGRNRPVNY